MRHPDPERLALAALPAEPADPELTAHLQRCEACLDQVVELRRTVELARAGDADPGPDAALAPPPPRVWQAIVDELSSTAGAPAAVPPAAPPAAAPPPVPAPVPLPRRPARRWTAALVAAGLVVGLAGGVGIGLALAPRTPAEVPLAQLAPLAATDPGATGTVDAVQRDGVRHLVVRLDGVTDTAGADYLEAWVMDPLGTRLVSLGALARDGDGAWVGDFSVPPDLPVAELGVVDVSAERWDGDERHSRTSLLRGVLT